MKINPELLPTRQVATASFDGFKTNLPNGIISMGYVISNSSNLTLSGGGIRIGKGIKTILVSGNLFFQSSANNGYVWTGIYVNSTLISVSISNPTSYFASTSHSPKIANVNEGDIVTLRGLEAKNGTIRDNGNTYITVEVIE